MIPRNLFVFRFLEEEAVLFQIIAIYVGYVEKRCSLKTDVNESGLHTGQHP